MANSRQGLVLVVVLAAISLGLIWLGIDNLVLRLIFALPLVLFLPGYAIQAAALDNPRLGVPERFVLSTGLSISVVILTGLVLNATPWKLDVRIWALLLALVTWAAVLVFAWQSYRRYGLTPLSQTGADLTAGINRQIRKLYRSGRNSRLSQNGSNDGHSAVTIPSRAVLRRPGLRLFEVVLLGAALLLAAFAVGVTRLPAPPGNLEGYTLFWLLPGEGNQSGVHLGIQSMEVKPTVYRIELYAGDQVVQVWEDVQLDPDQTWEQNLDLPQETYGTQSLTAWLYRADQPDHIYRRVVLRRAQSQSQ